MASPQADQAPRVLVADDHATNRRVVELILGAAGAQLMSVENGAEALEAFRDGRFDRVLMDMQMPVMDGLSAIAAIRRLEADEGRQHTPVLALTANAMPEHVKASDAAGADERCGVFRRDDELGRADESGCDAGEVDHRRISR